MFLTRIAIFLVMSVIIYLVRSKLEKPRPEVKSDNEDADNIIKKAS